MIKWAILFLVAVTSGLQVQAGTVSLKNLDAQEDVVLQDRLQRMLQVQSEKLKGCRGADSRTQEAFRAWSPLLVKKELFNFNDSERQTEILFLIHALRTSKTVLAECTSDKRLAIIQSVRKPIFFPVLSLTASERFLRDLAPAYFPVAGRGSFQEKENNACFAGDAMIFSDARKLEIALPEDALRLSQALFQTLMQTSVRGSLDLFSVFAQTFPGKSPTQMFTLLAAFTTSGNSGLTGWLQGVEDQLLVSDLNRLDLSDSQVFARSKQLQLAKITYQKFRDVARRFEAKLTLFGQDINAWNRHNFMAAYLGCRDEGRRALAIHRVHMIGVGYESKDFVFHLLEGVKLKDSAQNFREDSHRYSEGAAIGWDACRRSP